jgi:hydrogenase/urease accessory protein HupE
MRALLIIALIALLASTASAHGMRTAHVEISELEVGKAIVQLQLGAPDPALAITADGCEVAPADAEALFVRSWRVACPDDIGAHRFALVGLGPITSEAVVSIALVDGTTATELVRPDAPDIVPRRAAPTPAAIAAQFVGLGLVHIATGYDHLLFLLLIVLLLRDVKSVLLAETAFTISHSLSFSATALGWIHLSPAAAETCIALSLLMLAADIDLRRPALRWRGAAMALVFGLVHGLGFAGGLHEIGLPDREIGYALIGFGAGVELGQVAFLALALAALYIVKRRPRIELAGLYAIGGLSAYLVLTRALQLI